MMMMMMMMMMKKKGFKLVGHIEPVLAAERNLARNRTARGKTEEHTPAAACPLVRFSRFGFVLEVAAEREDMVVLVLELASMLLLLIMILCYCSYRMGRTGGGSAELERSPCSDAR
jgi:hypothetical protein